MVIVSTCKVIWQTVAIAIIAAVPVRSVHRENVYYPVRMGSPIVTVLVLTSKPIGKIAVSVLNYASPVWSAPAGIVCYLAR